MTVLLLDASGSVIEMQDPKLLQAYTDSGIGKYSVKYGLLSFPE